MTKYATALLRLVQAAENHPTAEQLYRQLKPDFPGVSLSTVYNNLNALADKGMLRRITSAGSPDRYDGGERHDHLICRKCGAISDVTLQDLTDQLRQQVGEGFVSYQVQVEYLCPACRGAEGAAVPEASAGR